MTTAWTCSAACAFGFSVEDGPVRAITVRAAAEVLADVVRRDGAAPRG